MPSFQCDGCGDVIKKPKTVQHAQQCSCFGGYTCLDCHKNFDAYSVKTHISCISEAEKYQGALYQPKGFKKNGNNVAARTPNKAASPAPAKTTPKAATTLKTAPKAETPAAEPESKKRKLSSAPEPTKARKQAAEDLAAETDEVETAEVPAEKVPPTKRRRTPTGETAVERKVVRKSKAKEAEREAVAEVEAEAEPEPEPEAKVVKKAVKTRKSKAEPEPEIKAKTRKVKVAKKQEAEASAAQNDKDTQMLMEILRNRCAAMTKGKGVGEALKFQVTGVILDDLKQYLDCAFDQVVESGSRHCSPTPPFLCV
eukprot:TRINITY_DN18065_c0_g1_i1.p1 TRINITY_DN18065_c0_g1~~TRINITY_DN18065_c0_g1_i1.p1  ORF type:complete len:327 (+),score=90.84 TRINITY_DN18065_c0_g1_i1:47-982(+)